MPLDVKFLKDVWRGWHNLGEIQRNSHILIEHYQSCISVPLLEGSQAKFLQHVRHAFIGRVVPEDPPQLLASGSSQFSKSEHGMNFLTKLSQLLLLLRSSLDWTETYISLQNITTQDHELAKLCLLGFKWSAAHSTRIFIRKTLYPVPRVPVEASKVHIISSFSVPTTQRPDADIFPTIEMTIILTNYFMVYQALPTQKMKFCSPKSKTL